MNTKETISGLEQVLFSLHPKAKGIYDAIETVKSIGVSLESSTQGKIVESKTTSNNIYDPKSNMRVKTLYAIRELNRFVKNKEIAQFLHEKEPDVPAKDFVIALSNPLYYLKNENRIKKLTIGTGNLGVYWGSAKWLKEDGLTPKEEHMYIEEPKEEPIEI